MISLNTINQIEDIMTILNNTRKSVAKPQSGKSYDQVAQEAVEHTAVQTPNSIIKQTTVVPAKLDGMFSNSTCCVKDCNKPAVLWVKNIPYCREHDPTNRINTEEE